MSLTDEDLRKIQVMLAGLATKDDLRNFATKADLRGFATKDELRFMKDELMTELSKKADKVDLAKKADKTDIDRMESRVITVLGLVERDHDTRLTDLEVWAGRLEGNTAH